jgi:hypothetical protein
VYCLYCGARQGAEAPAGAGAPPPAPPVAGPPPVAGRNPWEELPRRGFFPALGETLQLSLFHPTEFFRRTTAPDRVGAALLYAILVGTVSALVALLWQRSLGSPLEMIEGGGKVLPLVERQSLAVTVLALPLGFAAWTILLTGILHVSLFFVGGARAGLSATLKAVAYSFSANAFLVFPVCGAPIGVVWFVVLNIVGLRELHRISTGRAVLAWVLPFLLATCFAAVGAALLAALLGKFWLQLGGASFDV